jgi:hypothetical protein
VVEQDVALAQFGEDVAGLHAVFGFQAQAAAVELGKL